MDEASLYWNVIRKSVLRFSIDHALVFQHPEVACSYRMRSKSVIAWGKVAYEEDFDKKVEALDIIMKQYSDKTFRYSDPAVRNVKILDGRYRRGQL